MVSFFTTFGIINPLAPLLYNFRTIFASKSKMAAVRHFEKHEIQRLWHPMS